MTSFTVEFKGIPILFDFDQSLASRKKFFSEKQAILNPIDQVRTSRQVCWLKSTKCIIDSFFNPCHLADLSKDNNYSDRRYMRKILQGKSYSLLKKTVSVVKTHESRKKHLIKRVESRHLNRS